VSDPRTTLRTAYRDLVGLLGPLPEEDAFTPTGCRGWAVVDLAYHLLGDARRALVALATPEAGPPDATAVDYWRPHRPSRSGDADELWPTRAAASLMGGFDVVRRAYGEAAEAVLVAADRADLEAVVRTHSSVLTVRDLVSTLVVEAAVHHLDLVVALDRPGPAAGPLAEARRVFEGLHGGPLPAHWDDASLVLWGAGRRPLTDAARADLGPGVARFPLLG
jgi:uncharacterized protein (TIGR03083 family)